MFFKFKFRTDWYKISSSCNSFPIPVIKIVRESRDCCCPVTAVADAAYLPTAVANDGDDNNHEYFYTGVTNYRTLAVQYVCWALVLKLDNVVRCRSILSVSRNLMELM